MCKNCKRSFHWSNYENKHNQERIWFERWQQEGYSVRQLSQQSKHSSSKLYRILNYWLKKTSHQNLQSIQNCKHAIFDGTFLHRPNSIVVMMSAKHKQILFGKYGVCENSERDMFNFFYTLRRQGLKLESCTVDGNAKVIKMLYKTWPNIIVQRCLVHIQRQGAMWCRRRPKRTDAKHLRKLFIKLPYIKTTKEGNTFLNEVDIWENKYGNKIKTIPEKGKVFSDIKRARSMLLKAIPNLFHYLENSDIPHTTNALEGYFSRLKRDYRNHRGLKPNKRSDYFRWYFNLKSK